MGFFFQYIEVRIKSIIIYHWLMMIDVLIKFYMIFFTFEIVIPKINISFLHDYNIEFCYITTIIIIIIVVVIITRAEEHELNI